MIQSLVDRLSHHYRRMFAGTDSAPHAPLLDAAHIHALALHAQPLPDSLLEFRRLSSHPLIGETQSLYRGRGLDFEENRAYQAGDEPRLLNWRLYARSGELYTKVYAEERRPQLCVVLDRRARMRFGTRVQLKVTLAAKVAICYAQQARQQAVAVGGVVLNPVPEWFAPALGDVSLETLVQAMVAPCPPIPFEAPQADLTEQLQQVAQRLPVGSLVLLLSDFADLDPDAAVSVLHQLAALHTVRAIQILDSIEVRLPGAGNFQIEDPTDSQPLRIQGRDDVQHDLYTRALEERQARLFACFRECAIPAETVTAQDDVSACLEPRNAHAH